MNARRLLGEDALDAVIGRTIGSTSFGEIVVEFPNEDGVDEEHFFDGATLYLNGGGNISFYDVPFEADPEGEGVGIVFYPDGMGAEEDIASTEAAIAAEKRGVRVRVVMPGFASGEVSQQPKRRNNGTAHD